MKTKDILLALRTKNGLSQDGLTQKCFVTRQAVSRWETGETLPNTETLKRLSQLYNVSINTLLGAPRTLVCQCCGMPLDDTIISHEPNGTFNEDYCTWCYSNGTYAYSSLEDLLNFLVHHMTTDTWTTGQVRTYFDNLLPTLNHWQETET